jgi:primosomal protein N' (replication factor Y)
MNQFLADIALPVPLDRTFTYLVPPELQAVARIGSRALVPFGKKTLTGIIVALPSSTTVRGLKPVRDILDARSTFSVEMLELTRWIAEYYLVPWGEALRAATPQGISQASKRIVSIVQEILPAAIPVVKSMSSLQSKILAHLEKKKSLSVAQLSKAMGNKGIHSALSVLVAKGRVTVSEELQRPKVRPKVEKFVALTLAGTQNRDEEIQLPRGQRATLETLRAFHASVQLPKPLSVFLKESKVSLALVKALQQKRFVEIREQIVVRTSGDDNPEPKVEITPNEHQVAALSEIRRALGANTYQTFLLHGVTGSGKTYVYIEAIRAALEKKKTAIVLVPEISLTPQTVRRFRAHFGDAIAVMHSALSVGERYDAWRQAHEGKVQVVIGPRSAIFAPLENIGLIVVDEEHEASYKQFDAAPRYNARDVAIIRARNTNAVVLLGSATPSIESYFNAHEGKYRLLELPIRVDRAQMPRIDIVDMLKERRSHYEALKSSVKASALPFPKRLPDRSVSTLLHEQIADRIAKREGTILLQNRRGFSHVMECFDCGFVEKCDNCEVSLTFHAPKRHLRCHYCGFVKKPPSVCPSCQGVELRLHAFGTQQVQEELQSLFPKATLLRMDRDTTTHRGAHDKILQQFGKNDAQILLGTQMVAKGLDFPHVTLVGVISADTQMLLPDFRASERTFQLLTQVAGRAGRSNLAGEVVIQTLQPQHYSLAHVVAHDYFSFYQQELAYRKELDYPPFSRIILIEFSGVKENDVQHHARKFAEFLLRRNAEKKFIVLGPADAAIARINNRFRKHVVVKDLKNVDASGAAIKAALVSARQQYEASPLGKSRAVSMLIDVDPQGMM